MVPGTVLGELVADDAELVGGALVTGTVVGVLDGRVVGVGVEVGPVVAVGVGVGSGSSVGRTVGEG